MYMLSVIHDWAGDVGYQVPVVLVLGNHDDRERYLHYTGDHSAYSLRNPTAVGGSAGVVPKGAVTGSEGDGGQAQGVYYAIDAGPVRWLVLDSDDKGYAQTAWLQKQCDGAVTSTKDTPLVSSQRAMKTIRSQGEHGTHGRRSTQAASGSASAGTARVPMSDARRRQQLEERSGHGGDGHGHGRERDVDVSPYYDPGRLLASLAMGAAPPSGRTGTGFAFDGPNADADADAALYARITSSLRSTIAFTHVAPYTEWWDPQTWAAGEDRWPDHARDALLPLLERCGGRSEGENGESASASGPLLALVSGHSHIYQRGTLPSFNQTRLISRADTTGSHATSSADAASPPSGSTERDQGAARIYPHALPSEPPLVAIIGGGGGSLEDTSDPANHVLDTGAYIRTEARHHAVIVDVTASLIGEMGSAAGTTITAKQQSARMRPQSAHAHAGADDPSLHLHDAAAADAEAAGSGHQGRKGMRVRSRIDFAWAAIDDRGREFDIVTSSRDSELHTIPQIHADIRL